VEVPRTFRSTYKHGPRPISEAGLIRGHAKVAVGKFKTEKTGGNVEGSVGQGYRPSDEEPLCSQSEDDMSKVSIEVP
jgi:hypothetical protein